MQGHLASQVTAHIFAPSPACLVGIRDPTSHFEAGPGQCSLVWLANESAEVEFRQLVHKSD